MEKEFPDIAKKAKKFLSYEVYFELSKQQKPMTADDPYYDLLMKKQKLIIDRIMADYEKHTEISSVRTGEKLDKKD